MPMYSGSASAVAGCSKQQNSSGSELLFSFLSSLLLLWWCSFSCDSGSPSFTAALLCSAIVSSYETFIGERWPSPNLRRTWRRLMCREGSIRVKERASELTNR